MLNQNSNRVWELKNILLLNLNEKEQVIQNELVSILNMSARHLEESIGKGQPISSIEELQDNIDIILAYCKSEKIQIKNDSTLSYILKLICYEAVKNTNNPACTKSWLQEKKSELSDYFKKISNTPSNNTSIKLIVNFLEEAKQPIFALKCYAAGILILGSILVYRSLQEDEQEEKNDSLINLGIFAAKCLCFLPPLGRAYGAAINSYNWVSTLFKPAKDVNPVYINPPSPAPE